jgi:hypothetical protein
MAIAKRHAEVYFAFHEVIVAAEGSQEHPVFLDEFDKYRLWAGNVGAAHVGSKQKLSLDYRLRESTLYRDQVPLKALFNHINMLALLHDTFLSSQAIVAT